MNTSTAPGRADEIERYLAGVSAALADLPAQVRQELLEDLPDHLAEIAADDPASLDSRLGPPPAYAAELRAAVGVDLAKHRRQADRLADRWAETVAALRPHVRTLDEKLGRLIGYDRLVDFLVLLRPAWWVLRGYLVGMALLFLFANGYDVFPQDSDAGLLGWPLVVVLVGLSIRIGRQPLHLMRRIGPRGLAAGSVAVVFAAWSLTLLPSSHPPPVYESPGYGYESPTEVYVYTESGQPVTNVRVFDRHGGAVPVGVPMGCDQPEYGYHQERRGCIPRDEQTGSAEPGEPAGPDDSVAPSGSAGSPGPSGSATPSGSAGAGSPGPSGSMAPSPGAS